MSDELLPYYDRELTYIRQLAAKFAEDHPKIAERLRLDPRARRRPARGAADRGVRLSDGAGPAQARRRVPRDHRVAARRPLSALPGADPLDGDRAVRGRPRADQGHDGYPIPPRTELETDPIGGRAVPVPHVLPGDALAARGQVGDPDAAAVPGPGRPAPAGPGLGPAPRDLDRLEGDAARVARGPHAALLPPRPAPARLPPLRADLQQRDRRGAGRLARRRRPDPPGPGLPRPGRVRLGRGPAAIPRPIVPRLSPADGVLRVPPEVPLRRPRPARPPGAWAAGATRSRSTSS